MAKDNVNISVGRKGMNRDAHPSLLHETEYTMAFNANYEDESGNGLPLLQNEHSNLLCSIFKEGYKVIGHKFDLNRDRTYFFLTNPETKESEIGYISSIQNITSVEDIDVMCGCNLSKKLTEPLEELEQVPSCTYTTLISDSCNKCLNFSIDYPIKVGNIELKDEKCGKRLYWTDNYNPPRYIDLGELEKPNYNATTYKSMEYGDLNHFNQYTYTGSIVCDNDKVKDIEETCIDCEKLRIFPLFEKPCISPLSIQYGGQLKAGVYEFMVAYCDKLGNEISQYYSITNPISIFDENHNIITQKDLDYVTNFGIRLEVSNLDEKFSYYKVAVIQRADKNAATSYFIEGVHPISDKTVLYYNDVDKQRTNLNHLLAVKPTYTKTEMLTASNGYLFQAGLTAEKEYNLQPVVNLLGAFVRWQTVRASEDLYKDGVNNSLYRGYMRDEVYPLSIRFYTTEGFETSNFVLVNRPPNSKDLEVVNNKDTESVLSYSPNCSENGRVHRWQFYNTATVIDTPCSNDSSATEVELQCKPERHKAGKFGYWESVEIYPDNEELFNSRRLNIDPNTVPSSIKSEFEEYFTDGVHEGAYLLKEETDLSCRNIRHYKFPSNAIAPFMSDDTKGSFQKSFIYPLGIHIDNDIISFFLDVAVNNGLITEEQRSKIDKYEIFRGDRTLHKGVIAKGLSFDMYKYNESEESTDILYPNYPYNDLRDDSLHYTDKERNSFVKHPYGGSKNNNFTFHSPDTHFHKPSLPTEVKVEAYQFGKSKGQFVEVEGHSKWVILTDKAYTLATTLAAVEVVAELAIKYGDFQVQNAIAGDRYIHEMEYGKAKVKTKGEGSYEGSIDNSSIPDFRITGTANSIGSLDFDTSGEGEYEGKPEDNWVDYGEKPDEKLKSPDNFTNAMSGGTPSLEREEGDKTKGNVGKKAVNINTDKVTTTEKILVLGSLFSSTFGKFGKYRYEWLKIFRDNGNPRNFAFYYTSEGWYNNAIFTNQEGNTIRGLSSKAYLKAGRHRVNQINTTQGSKESLKINNVDRESSVFLSFGEDFNLVYPTIYSKKDKSRFKSSDVGVGKGVTIDLKKEDDSGNALHNFTYDSRSPEVVSDIASPYMSLCNYLPSQYGEIESIKWIPTGFCGKIGMEGECSLVFGGDIFISRFSLKRKIPLFLTNAIDLANLTPFNYYPYRNIGHPVFYGDYEVTEMNQLGTIDNAFLSAAATILTLGAFGTALPQFKSYFKFDNYREDNLYVISPSKFYLFYYGIPQFLVESEINCNYRYATGDLEDNFYPNVGDYVNWTQEKTVSIRRDNSYNYNDTYSKITTMVGNRVLPSTYSSLVYNCLYDAPNGVIYSGQDNSEQELTDPWLIYRPLDKYQFKTSAGKLIDLKNIESSQVLGRFEHKVILFNAVDQIRDRLTPNNYELGTGGVFQTRPLEFKSTDLGYAGTQHKAMVSCEFGHFWADAKRGQVFQLDQNGRNLKEITVGLRNWFKEHLPFKIVKTTNGLFTDNDVDNNYKGLGIAMGWDSRYKRVFLTKKDYFLKEPVFRMKCGKVVSESSYRRLIAQKAKEGYTYVGEEDCQFVFSKETISTIPATTNIHAIFDTTSMGTEIIRQGETVLREWYNQYKASNPNYTGELIIEKQSREDYLSVAKGLYDKGLAKGNTNIIYLSFIDESNSEYHGGSLNLDNQPKRKFISDYKAFKETYPKFEYFKGIHYPLYRDYNGETAALVLQSIASIKGRLLTDEDIAEIGTDVDISLLKTENPYSGYVVDESTGEVYEPLENLGWVGKWNRPDSNRIQGTKEYENPFTIDIIGKDLNNLLKDKSRKVIEYVREELRGVDFDNKDYFEDCSFTLAYSPITQSWLSYYSFKPDYYLSFHNYFQTGLNYSPDKSEVGLWSHLLTNKSYQVFYGKRYGWLIEVPIKEQYTNKILKSIEYWLDTRRYHNEFDFAERRNIGFNKAWIYNNSNNTGGLSLVTENKNDLYQKLQYPKVTPFGTEILATQEDKKWTFNHFYNRVRNELNNVPIWYYDKNQIIKNINKKSLTHNQIWKDRLRGDWFLLRLVQDNTSQYKQIFKWLLSKEKVY